MKTFKEYLSTHYGTTSLTEATVTNDGTIGALLGILKQDPKVIRYLKYYVAHHGVLEFNIDLLRIKGENSKLKSKSAYKTIETKSGKYELPIVNTGNLSLHYGPVNSGYDDLILYFDADDANFTISTAPDVIVREEGGIRMPFFDDHLLHTNGSADYHKYVLFDVTDKQVINGITNPKKEIELDTSNKWSTVIKYKTSDIIPLSSAQKVVEKIAKGISAKLAKKTPPPEIKDVKFSIFFDKSRKVDTKKLVSKFSEFETYDLDISEFTFYVKLRKVDLTITNLERIYNDINPTGGHFQIL
jgi:hypothetical protein